MKFEILSEIFSVFWLEEGNICVEKLGVLLEMDELFSLKLQQKMKNPRNNQKLFLKKLFSKI